MRTNTFAVVVGLSAALLLATTAPAQKKKAPVRKTGTYSSVETGLAGIKLFDSGTRVVAVYGSPDQIEAVVIGGGGAGPGGGAAGGAGGRGLPGAAGGRASAAPPPPGGSGGSDFFNSSVPGDLSFGNEFLQGGVLAPQLPPSARGGGNNGGGGATGPVGGTSPSGGGNGVPGQSGGSTSTLYTRWVYNRKGAKYGFILDKNNRVVQCEAIGITSGKARTRRGITFGSSFATIIKKYGAPDGYEISGDNSLVVRYLRKAKCAFRLSRLGVDKPHVVTGIVVAAGAR